MENSELKEPLVIGRYDKKVATKLDVSKHDQPLVYEEPAAHSYGKGSLATALSPENLEPEYFRDRAEIERRGQQLAFDHRLSEIASDSERNARRLIEIIRHNDEVTFYSDAPALEGYRGQKHHRFAGDHFLTNLDLLERTVLFKAAQELPKGAHLHIHFNSTLLPHVLLDIAQDMTQMYISSDKPLTSTANFDTCEIQFLMKSQDTVEDEQAQLREIVSREDRTVNEAYMCNLFHESYTQRTNEKNQRLSWMRYEAFRDQWDVIRSRRLQSRERSTTRNPFSKRRSADNSNDIMAFDLSWRDWLISKLVFDVEEAHNSQQTSEGAWEKFNGRTRMMKGLFNYQTAYEKYTRACLEEFERDKIQYAEIRPNFMMTNQIFTDDGKKQLDNTETMRKIVEAFCNFKNDNPNTNLCGLKVIYCTPRSFSPKLVQAALDQCLEFKRNPEFTDYIAGFDLVGEEAQGKPLKDFIPQFLDFKRKCRLYNVDIPFLFHCGETLELGGDTDGNLVDALLLDSKRIGHGFALSRKPYLITEFKKRDICLEICPISNQVLGLTPRMNGHAMYDLLANNVPCTISSDNGTLFKSTLSHDFYEVMVGSKAMNLHGWRQLIEWSIKHASLEPNRLEELRRVWEPLWDNYINWINETFKDIKPITRPAKPPTAKRHNEADDDMRERIQREHAQYERDEAEFLTMKVMWKTRAEELGALPSAGSAKGSL